MTSWPHQGCIVSRSLLSIKTKVPLSYPKSFGHPPKTHRPRYFRGHPDAPIVAPETLDLVPEPRTIAKALEWLGSIATHEAWDPQACHDMLLVLDETISNILHHAFKPDFRHAIQPAIRLQYHREGRIIEKAA